MPEQNGQTPKTSRAKTFRDLAIFAVGLLGFVHEVFYTTADRPFLLLLSGSMMGLPAMLRLDEYRKGG